MGVREAGYGAITVIKSEEGGRGHKSQGELRKENGLRVGEKEREIWDSSCVPHLGKLAEPMGTGMSVLDMGNLG